MKKMSKAAAVRVAAGMLFTGVEPPTLMTHATGTATPQTAETAPTNGRRHQGRYERSAVGCRCKANAPRQSRKPRRRLMQRPTPLLRKVMGRRLRLKSQKVF
ncbi:MAG: hypothetical protein ACLT4Y_02070 [Bifidobacterium breve]